jgi:hypothetical protein
MLPTLAEKLPIYDRMTSKPYHPTAKEQPFIWDFPLPFGRFCSSMKSAWITRCVDWNTISVSPLLFIKFFC